MVSQTLTGVLLATGALCGLIWSCRTELRRDYYARYDHWNDAPRSFVAAFGNAALLGAGAGMTIALLVLAAVALVSQVQ